MQDPLFMQRMRAVMGMGGGMTPMLLQLIEEDPRLLEAMAAAQGLLISRPEAEAPKKEPEKAREESQAGRVQVHRQYTCILYHILLDFIYC